MLDCGFSNFEIAPPHPPAPYEQMSWLLRLALAARDLRTEEVAQRLGVSNGYLSRVLNGKKPGHNIRHRLAAILGISEQSLAKEIDKAKSTRRAARADQHA